MPKTDQRQPLNIADPYRDLLAQLDEGRRRGVVQQLADGYYQGWRPTRAELASMIFQTASNGDGPPLSGAATVTQRSATGIRRAPDLNPTNRTPSSSIAAARQGVQSGSGPALPMLASFQIDCGELIPKFRFVATGVTHDGTTVRDQTLCRMIWLNYELIPLSVVPGGHRTATPPPVFTGPIVCISDTRTHNSQDGRRRRHAAPTIGFSGSRGPWPLIMTTRQVKFLIGQNAPAVGGTAHQQPAGTLVVDISSGSAIWQPRV